MDVEKGTGIDKNSFVSEVPSHFPGLVVVEGNSWCLAVDLNADQITSTPNILVDQHKQKE